MAQLPCHGPLLFATFSEWLAMYFHYGVSFYNKENPGKQVAATFHQLETPKTSHSCLKKWYFPIFSKMIILQHSLSAAINHRGKSRIGLPELDRPFSGSLTSAKEDRKAKVKIVYGIFTYIYHKNQPNVGKLTIHGSFGLENFDQLLLL